MLRFNKVNDRRYIALIDHKEVGEILLAEDETARVWAVSKQTDKRTTLTKLHKEPVESFNHAKAILEFHYKDYKQE
jgi:hypothetical protein